MKKFIFLTAFLLTGLFSFAQFGNFKKRADLEKFKDRVFRLYSRFHRNADGKGIGLYLVKTQVELLGGTISIESKVNVGTSFEIIIPINR